MSGTTVVNANTRGIPILLVEDDSDVARLMHERLSLAGFVVIHAASVAAATACFEQRQPRILLVDWMLPDGSGVDWIASLRAEGHTLPACLLTAKDALEDKLRGFSAGADDYLTKPFALDELLARVHALLKRAGVQSTERDLSAVGDLVIDHDARQASISGRVVPLTRREFDVLVLLASRMNKVVSRDQLIAAAWPANRDVSNNTVDVYISYLRKKLEPTTLVIETSRGVGFQLREIGG